MANNKKTLQGFLDELASPSPAPGGGSVAALAGALGAALTSMVCHLTLGKKKYAGVEESMRAILKESEDLRARFTVLIEKDTEAFNKVMEAFNLPKENDAQRALRDAAIVAATKEATLVPLEVMKHCIDGLALAQKVAANGNRNSVSDAGVSALMLHAGCESAALNVKINLRGLSDTEFVHWKSEEMESILRTSRKMLEETQAVVAAAMTAA
jgi:formiminotetrahydrofolate cyclodeaminase